jgi:CheY-like chemotaxis protein
MTQESRRDGSSSRGEDSPVVVVTADGPDQRAHLLAADGYLQKPMLPENLLTEVEKFCRKPD